MKLSKFVIVLLPLLLLTACEKQAEQASEKAEQAKAAVDEAAADTAAAAKKVGAEVKAGFEDAVDNTREAAADATDATD
ncbi:MAG: hypothetical protein PF630_04660 [Gammaproteobacteria bacterium]|jgi:hypothetical protein|nr:hypothetical protein [Gammaproteobacteria bacterium]